jgi:hypothetical protein
VFLSVCLSFMTLTKEATAPGSIQLIRFVQSLQPTDAPIAYLNAAT